MPVDIQRIEMNQLACWRVRRGEDELLIAEQGAQILSYRQGDAPPIIWLSEEAAFEQGQSVRGGVPVLAMVRRSGAQPTRGPGELPRRATRALPRPGARPCPAIAGAARRRRYGDSRVPLPAGARRTAGLAAPGRTDTADPPGRRAGAQPQQPQRWHAGSHHQPGPAQLLRRQRHPSGSRAAGCPYIDTLLDWQQRQQQNGDLAFNGETDRIYLQLPTTLRLVDPAWKRSIQLTTRGSRSAVLWNP